MFGVPASTLEDRAGASANGMKQMTNVLGVVEVDLSGPRREKLVARRLGGKPLLEWVVRQVTDCQCLARAVVLSDSTSASDAVWNCVPSDVPVLRPPGKDSLARACALAEHYGASAIVRVGTETPFVDPVLIDRLIRTAREHASCDYVSYCSADGRSALFSPVGAVAEWCSAAALRRANRDAVEPRCRGNITRYLLTHPEVFNIRLIPLPAEMDRQDVRLRVDSEEDWDHVQQIFDALGPERLDWKQIAGLLDHSPQLRRRMALLNQSRPVEMMA